MHTIIIINFVYFPLYIYILFISVRQRELRFPHALSKVNLQNVVFLIIHVYTGYEFGMKFKVYNIIII